MLPKTATLHKLGQRRLKHSLDGIAPERVSGVTEGRDLGVSGHTVDSADDATFRIAERNSRIIQAGYRHWRGDSPN